jgi:hypothetical protein
MANREGKHQSDCSVIFGLSMNYRMAFIELHDQEEAQTVKNFFDKK